MLAWQRPGLWGGCFVVEGNMKPQGGGHEGHYGPRQDVKNSVLCQGSAYLWLT